MNTNQMAANITHGMMQPVGKLLQTKYSSIPADQNGEQWASAVGVLFKTPAEDTQSRKYGDGPYGSNNQHLQLLAAIGKQPTDYDGQTLDLRDDECFVELAYADGPETGWHLSQSVFARGEKALHSADWNPFTDGSDGAQNDSAVTVNVGGS